MHTIEVPIKREDILDFIYYEEAKRKIKRKSVGGKRPKGSYYRYGFFKPSQIVHFKSFSECKPKDATHIQLKINDKNLFYKVKRLFDGKEKWSYDFDETEDIKLSKKAPKSSWISYDKMLRDTLLGRKDDSERLYKVIRMMYANNDEVLAEDLSTDWHHQRLELRLLNPGMPGGQQPLDPTEEATYPKILTDLERRIKPLSIVLIRPDVTSGVYVNHCRKMQNGQDKPLQVEPNKYQHGKMLKAIDYIDSISNELDMIKSFFFR